MKGKSFARDDLEESEEILGVLHMKEHQCAVGDTEAGDIRDYRREGLQDDTSQGDVLKTRKERQDLGECGESQASSRRASYGERE